MKSLNKILIIILVAVGSIRSDSIDDLKSSTSQIKDNVNNLQGDLDANADMFVQAKNLQTSINSLLDTVKTFITTSPENAKKVNNSIADEFRSLVGDVVQDMSGIAEIQNQAFTQEVAVLSDSLNKTISGLQQNINSYISSFDPQVLLGYVFNMDTGDILNYASTIKANITQAQLKANQQLNSFTNQLNTFIDTQLKNDKDLAVKLKAKYAQKISNEKVNINTLFSTIQKYLLDVAGQIVAIYNQINKTFIAIVNDLIQVLTHIKNITEGSSDLFRAILNFPIIPPVYTLGDTFQGTIKGMFLDFENDADQSKDILNEFISALTDLTKSGVPNFFYLIINIFKGIFNCPVGAAVLAADIFAAVDNSNEDIQAIMNIVKPDANNKTQMENDMQAVIDQGTQIAHSVKDIVLIKYDPLNLALQNLLKNDVLVLLRSIIKIMQRGIDSINAFSRNIRVGLLCFNQPTIKYCPCSTVNLTGISKCLKDVECPCSCPMNDALNQIVSLLNSLSSQVDSIQNNIKEIETDVLKTATYDLYLIITGILFLRSAYKWVKGKVKYQTYDEFEEQLANLGLTKDQIKAATKNLDQKALNEMQDRYNEGLESPAKTREFVSYLEGKLNLTKDQANLLNERNSVWWKNSYDRIQKISKTFDSIPNKVLNENVGRVSEIFRNIENAKTVDDFYEALSALSDVTGIAKDMLVSNYVKAYTPGSNRITPWEIQSKIIQDRASALAELKNQADAQAQQRAGTVVDDSKEIAELQLDLKRLQDLKIQQPDNANIDQEIKEDQEKISEDSDIVEPAIG